MLKRALPLFLVLLAMLSIGVWRRFPRPQPAVQKKPGDAVNVAVLRPAPGTPAIVARPPSSRTPDVERASTDDGDRLYPLARFPASWTTAQKQTWATVRNVIDFKESHSSFRFVVTRLAQRLGVNVLFDPLVPDTGIGVEAERSHGEGVLDMILAANGAVYRLQEDGTIRIACWEPPDGNRGDREGLEIVLSGDEDENLLPDYARMVPTSLLLRRACSGCNTFDCARAECRADSIGYEAVAGRLRNSRPHDQSEFFKTFRREKD
jgi:hypothetical protein